MEAGSSKPGTARFVRESRRLTRSWKKIAGQKPRAGEKAQQASRASHKEAASASPCALNRLNRLNRIGGEVPIDPFGFIEPYGPNGHNAETIIAVFSYRHFGADGLESDDISSREHL